MEVLLWLVFVAVGVFVLVSVVRGVVVLGLSVSGGESAEGCNVLCAYPLERRGQEFGCGRCAPCRINKQRMWIGRLVLECLQHEASFFVTLTYRYVWHPPLEVEACMPLDGSVSLRDVQLFLKRLREQVRDVSPRLRYFLAAEYGDARGRPHYHAVLFGALKGNHVNPEKGVPYKGCDCVICRAWNKGNVFIGTVTLDSVSYVVSYLQKGKLEDSSKKYGFSVMSRRPGIGALAVSEFARAILDERTGELRLENQDVQTVFRYGGKLLPLGRFMRGKIRKAVFGSEKAPESAGIIRAMVVQEEVRSLGYREWSRRKGLKRLKSLHSAEVVVRLEGEKR